VRPSGPGKTIFLLAGMVLFLSLGVALAVALAVIDDRLYRRADIDQLGIAVLAVIPPPEDHKAAKPLKEAA
jgi:capsular polysaccharide biosynthesis protein